MIQANLGYYRRALDAAYSSPGWVIDAGLIALLGWVVVSRGRKRPRCMGGKTRRILRRAHYPLNLN